jgi:protein disulfide-isomerase
MRVLIFMAVLVSFAGCKPPPQQATASLQWFTDLPTAQARAKAEGKSVLLDFTGTDWCLTCAEFRREVGRTEAFRLYAESNLVLVEVDFPQRKPQTEELKKANLELLLRFKVPDTNGDIAYPTFILLDGEGRELTRMSGYAPRGGPESFINELEAARKGANPEGR